MIQEATDVIYFHVRMRYRLTKRSMLEIEEYNAIDSVQERDLWEREFNIPTTEVAPIVFDHKGSRHLVQ